MKRFEVVIDFDGINTYQKTVNDDFEEEDEEDYVYEVVEENEGLFQDNVVLEYDLQVDDSPPMDENTQRIQTKVFHKGFDHEFLMYFRLPSGKNAGIPNATYDTTLRNIREGMSGQLGFPPSSIRLFFPKALERLWEYDDSTTVYQAGINPGDELMNLMQLRGDGDSPRKELCEQEQHIVNTIEQRIKDEKLRGGIRENKQPTGVSKKPASKDLFSQLLSIEHGPIRIILSYVDHFSLLLSAQNVCKSFYNTTQRMVSEGEVLLTPLEWMDSLPKDPSECEKASDSTEMWVRFKYRIPESLVCKLLVHKENLFKGMEWYLYENGYFKALEVFFQTHSTHYPNYAGRKECSNIRLFLRHLMRHVNYEKTTKVNLAVNSILHKYDFFHFNISDLKCFRDIRCSVPKIFKRKNYVALRDIQKALKITMTDFNIFRKVYHRNVARRMDSSLLPDERLARRAAGSVRRKAQKTQHPEHVKCWEYIRDLYEEDEEEESEE